MKFAFLTINNRRPMIFNLFCASIKRLRKDIGYDFPVVCVSGLEDKKICANYGITHITHANSPATEKWNLGMVALRELHPEYVVVMGSDDIMSTDTLKALVEQMKLGFDMIGLNEVYVYDGDGAYQKGMLKHYVSGKVLGVGKCLHSRVLDEINWRGWQYYQPRNYGMDGILSRNTNRYIKTHAIVQGIIVDVKSKDSLNKFTMFVHNHKGETVNSQIFYDILSEEELEILKHV